MKREFNNRNFNIVELEKEICRNSKVMLENKNVEVKFETEDVINVYADDFIRLSRYVARESHSDNPDANEICRRFLDEANEHTESDMFKLNIDLNIENNNIVACVNEFLKYYMNSKE